MARKKKISGLSVAIVAMNIVIIGIILLLIWLIYLHMKEDIGNSRGESTTTPAQTTTQTAADTTENVSSSTSTQAGSQTAAQTTAPPITTAQSGVPQPVTYNPDFFKNDLFIGDSISTGLYLYSYLDKNNVFAEVGLNPESAATHQIDGVTCIDKATSMQPKHIYIMLGSNGLAFLDGSYMANKLKDLVQLLKTACPSSQIYIISIPPVTKAHEAEGAETMAKVNSYNEALKKVCADNGYKFIDICTPMKDAEGYFSSKYAEADGLHFLGGAYQFMLSAVQKAAQ